MNTAAPSLRDLQIAFHGDLLGDRTLMGRHVDGDERLPAQRRLQVYRNAYGARLRDALRETFEKTWTYLGDDAFDALAAAFVRDHPPVERNLRWFGARFSHWLERALPDDPDVAELAALEWSLRCAFDAADGEPLPILDASRLATTRWTTAACRFAPALELLPVRFNTAAVWQALGRGEAPPAMLTLTPPGWLMVWRKGWQPRFRTIDDDEHAWLVALRSGRPLAAVCGQFGATAGAATAAALGAARLRQWCDEGVVVAIAD